MQQQRRAYWLKTLHQWHWITAALCLLGMLIFSFTGITLNHAAQIESKPRVFRSETPLPKSLLQQLTRTERTGEAPLPQALCDWMDAELSLKVDGRIAEWSKEEIYLPLPRPGGDA